MGQFIARGTRFEHRDFVRFQAQLREETERLHDWVERGSLSTHAPMAGLELEAWLVDSQGRPAPANEAFLQRLGSPDAVTELGRFNVEFNVPPQPVAGLGLQRLGDGLSALWLRAVDCAHEMGLGLVAVGILPTVIDSDLRLANLSDRDRYHALNQQVLRQRHGRAVQLDIAGPDGRRLSCEHHDVMLEAAATSFQVHLQLPADRIVRAYNAAVVAAAGLVALTGNSPLLFGHPLWQETRIPLFEQALGLHTREDGQHAGLPRVGLGGGYVGWSLVECFRENLERFEPLLPLHLEDPPERLAHLRLHNGTIWRWVRPILGFDDDGTPHLRIEFRPLAAGPSLPDMIANLALSIGAIAALAARAEPPEALLPFEAAAANLQAAACRGLGAQLRWLDGQTHAAADVAADLLDTAHAGLASLGVDPTLSAQWVALGRERLSTRRTGSRWQLARLALRQGSLGGLTRDYAQRQAGGAPVHLWD